MNTLDDILNQAVRQWNEQQRVERARKEAEQAAQEEEQKSRLSRLFEVYFTPEFRQSIGTFTFSLIEDWRGIQTLDIFFVFLGKEWHLVAEEKREGSLIFSIQTRRAGTKDRLERSNLVNGNQTDNLPPEKLQAALTLDMAMHREEHAKALKEKQEYEQRMQEHAREQEAQGERQRKQEEREQQERAKRIEAAQAEHERILAIIEEEKERTQQALWQWPEGITVEVYHLSYCTGSNWDEEERGFDYASGWTAMDHLDENGRIQIGEEWEHYMERERGSARLITLIPQLHKPVFEVHRADSVESLPKSLRRPVLLRLPQYQCMEGEDYERRLVEVQDPEKRSEYYAYKETLGEVPMEWVKTLVEDRA